jgi:predicted esterase
MRRALVAATVAAVVAAALADSRRSAADGPRAPTEGRLPSADDRLDRAARAAASDARIAPSPAGRLGAWLVAGPFRSATADLKSKPQTPDALTQPPPGVEESALEPRLGEAVPDGRARDPIRWTLASSSEGAIDVKAALKATQSDVVAYLAGTLHVEQAGRYVLLVGADDGLRVIVDGKPVLTRDEARPFRDDDDLVPIDLAAGDHAIVLKLHQRDGAWLVRARILDASLAPPLGAYLALPGTTADDARALARKMSWVSVDRGMHGAGYRPKLTVRFPEGAPRGVPLRVRAKLGGFFDVSAGEVPVDARGVGETVIALPALADADLPKLESMDQAFEIEVAERSVKAPFFPRRATREAVARVDRALAALEPRPAWLPAESLESVKYLRNRLVHFVSRGDADREAQADEARELDALAAALERQADPYEARTGPMRRALRSPVDGEPSEVGVYVPPGYRPGAKRTWPLVVALHGLNSYPMSMLRVFFGNDEPTREAAWKERHVGALPPLDAFVIAPSGHGNTMYRDLGEDDVLRALDWALRTYPIDPDRVTITGPSMGGIGAASIPLHHPDRFAASAPLCGYHSYFVRRDFIGRPLRPWERFLAEERSNVFWAENGARLPLWIVHGTQDLPESNSGVLIERYEKLGFSIKHDHPVAGHNVWQQTYEELKGAKWLLRFRRERHPASVRFKTTRTRWGDYAWLHVTELSSPDAWADVEARVRSRHAIDVRTTGAAELAIDRDDKLVEGAVTVTADGTALAFADGEPIVLHREAGAWVKGPASHAGAWKKGEITGPIRDVFHAPITFVYGASDPAQARANEEVARAFAQIRAGVLVKYPVMSDEEFFARGEALANERALFLVGNAKSNRVLREFEASLPIKVDGDAVVVGAQRFAGRQLGAAFIHPNPKKQDRYLVVVEGVDALGTWRALSLPDLLPDFVVWDESVGPARGQMNLSSAMLRAAGFFQNDWSLPAKIDDPLAKTARPAPKNEHEATPYLP